jgi:hypothetical protein
MRTETLATKRARYAALVRASMYDGKEVTAKARAAFMSSFFKDIPLDLPEDERVRLAEAKKKAHYAKMAYARAKGRAK